MLADEVGTYLAAAGLGLTVGTNLFTKPFPGAAAVDPNVSLHALAGDAPEGTFGPSGSSYAFERPELLVTVRGARDGIEAAETLAQAIYKALRRLGPVTLSNVLYHNIDATPPAFVAFDANQRPLFSVTCRIWKDESP